MCGPAWQLHEATSTEYSAVHLTYLRLSKDETIPPTSRRAVADLAVQLSPGSSYMSWFSSWWNSSRVSSWKLKLWIC